MKNILIQTCVFVIIIIVNVSCGSKAGNEQADNDQIKTPEEQKVELLQQVINLHDQVMPRMEEIANYQAQISTELDSLILFDSASVRVVQLKGLDIELQQADKAMWDWMHQFDANIVSREISFAETMEYLEGEMKKIEQVKQKVDKSIKASEAFFSK